MPFALDVMFSLPLTGSEHQRRMLSRCLLASPTLMNVVVVPPSNMQQWMAAYRACMRSTLQAVRIDLTPRCVYQLVQRVTTLPHTTSAKSVNGEVVSRKFVGLSDVESTLVFLESWRLAQQASAGQDRTCLLECGPCDATLRKWILDVDASREALRQDGMGSVSEAQLHQLVLRMASAVSRALAALGFLRQACAFAVLTRHTPKKMSWHVTLLALASHERWRHCLFAVERHYAKAIAERKEEEWIMYRYVDESTKNNSKGQYMQILGSTKVAPGVAPDGCFFEDAGLFDGRSMRLPPYTHPALRLAATSLSLPDPWSLPFVDPSVPTEPLVRRKVVVVPVPKKRKKAGEEEPTTTTSDDAWCDSRVSWDALPIDAQWMRLLVAHEETTRLTVIPSMQNPDYMCATVRRLVGSGAGRVLVHAMLVNPAICPRHWKSERKIYNHKCNHAIVVCVEQKSKSRRPLFRLFMRCFSDKCRSIPVQPEFDHKRQWIELTMQDYMAKKSLSSPS